MGYQRRVHGECTKYFQPRNMNKIAIVVCLAACVSAEADADALYGVYGYGVLAGYPCAGYSAYSSPYLGYAAGYGVSNFANSVGIAGSAPAAIPAVAGLYARAGRYVANSAEVVHVAKPEAEAAYLYGGYGYGGAYSPYVYGAGYGVAGYPYGVGYGGYRGHYYG